MNLGILIDVVIGTAAVFLVLSLVASAIRGAIAKVLETKAKELWRQLVLLLDPPADQRFRHARSSFRLTRGLPERPVAGSAAPDSASMVERLYAHPHITPLDPAWEGRKSRLRHVPGSTFAAAVVDLLAEAGSQEERDVGRVLRRHRRGMPPPGGSKLHELRAGIQALLPVASGARAALKMFADEAGETAGSSMAAFRSSVERWFEVQMAALSVAYRRRTRWVLVVISVVLVAVINLDALSVIRTLHEDAAVRAALATFGAELADDLVLADLGEDDTPSSTGSAGANDAGADDEGGGPGTTGTEPGRANADAQDECAPSTESTREPGPEAALADLTPECVRQVLGRLTATGIPLGWDLDGDCGPHRPCGLSEWVYKITGLALAAAAVAMGAPFWYDLLRRAAGFRRKVSGDEDDRT